MNQTEPDDDQIMEQRSKTLELCIDLTRKTLLRRHTSDYIDKHPEVLAACIQACAIDMAADKLSRKLDDIAQQMGKRE